MVVVPIEGSGEAIYIQYNNYGNSESYIKLNNTVVYGNSADRGGALYISNNNYNRKLNFQLDILNTIVYGNRADQGDGGAICM